MNENELKNVILPAGKYVVAVSGGVDSVVLLDILQRQTDLQLIVAHVDHGIRDDSAADARFVAALAEKYGLPFAQHDLHLGKNASEELARQGRYIFLKKMVKDHEADALVTAHHANDLLETIVMNLLRGTGWRGLCSLRSVGTVLRPLLAVTKQDLRDYALKEKLEWVEDETNTGDAYTRNRIRRYVIPKCLKKDSEFAVKLHDINHRQCELRKSIEDEVEVMLGVLVKEVGLNKVAFLGLNDTVAFEILRAFLRSREVRQTSPQLERLLEFIRTAKNQKRFSLDSMHFLEVRRHELVVVTAEN